MGALRTWSAYAAAQARVVPALLTALDPPFLGAGVRALLGAPRVEDSFVAGVPASIVRPGRGSGPWPAVVFIPGVTRLGRRHPAVEGLARGLAASGHLAVVPEPEGVTLGELTPATVDRIRAVAREVMHRPDSREGVVLAGVSGGATLALLAAADPALHGRVSAVAALAPCCDIELGIRVATTGTYGDGDGLSRFSSGSLLKVVAARSVVGSLADGPDRDALGEHLRGLDDDDPDPLAGLRAWPRDTLGSGARAVVELLANIDPDRYEMLYAALPEDQRRAVEALSAVRAASAVSAPVELVVPLTDKYIPLADATAFASAHPRTRLTVIDTLAHAVPRLAVREARSLGRLDGALVRLLATARLHSERWTPAG